MPIVTIRGQLGSGAPEIGKGVAELLHADYVDREIIAEVAARLQRDEQDVIAKEMPASSSWAVSPKPWTEASPSAQVLRGPICPPGKSPWMIVDICRRWSRSSGNWPEASRW